MVVIVFVSSPVWHEINLRYKCTHTIYRANICISSHPDTLKNIDNRDKGAISLSSANLIPYRTLH